MKILTPPAISSLILEFNSRHFDNDDTQGTPSMTESIDSLHPQQEYKSESLILKEPLVVLSNNHGLTSMNHHTPETDSKSYSHPPQDPREDPTVYLSTLSNGIVVHSSIDYRIHNNHHHLFLEDEISKEESPRWKDRLSKCCKYGICHPSYICGCCCSICGLAQILYRVISSKRIKLTVFWLITLFFIGHFVLEYFIYLNIVKYCIPDVISFMKNGTNRDHIWVEPSCLKWMERFKQFSYIYFAITVISVALVRHLVRKTYSILPSCRRRQRLESSSTTAGRSSECDDGWVEDCCFSIFCASCVTAQMMRHTGTYESFRASFCSYTGLTLVPRKAKKKKTDEEEGAVELNLRESSNTVENGSRLENIC